MIRAVGIAVALFCAASGASAERITSATYTEPTTRYAHGVLGDAIEYGAIELVLDTGSKLILRLPEERVFEDLEPRVQDLDGDGSAELIVIESHRDLGARLAVYDAQGFVAATPYIGRSNRWLAPLGAADLDEDGAMELAYIDRPHLAKTLRIWRFKDRALTHVFE